MSLWHEHEFGGREPRATPARAAGLSRRQVVGAVFGSVALMRLPWEVAAQATPTTALLSTGIFTAPDFGELGSVNLHWVETPDGLVLIDGLRTPRDAEAAVAVLRGLDQPVLAMLLTHPHPDHIGGLTTLRDAFGPVPIYADDETIAILREDQGGLLAAARAVPGDNYPADITLPDHPVTDGEDIILGGVTFEARVLGPGEAASMTAYHVPAANALFVGDIVNNGMTPVLINEQTGPWLVQLLTLAAEFPADIEIYPGHGPNGPHALLAAQAGYLTTVRELVRRQLTANGAWSDDAAATVLDELAVLYPGYRPVATAPGITDLNPEAVANELTATP